MSATAEETLGEIALKDVAKIKFKDEATTVKLKDMYLKCFMNTIQTTVEYKKYDIFMITGDIPAMWLRDSSVQVMHYLKYAPEEESVRKFLCQLMIRQFYCIVQDPYANAFMENPNQESQWSFDITNAAPIVWERKFEIDSLCYPVWLLNKYVECTADYSILEEKNVKHGLEAILNVFEAEIDHEYKSEYTFQRLTGKPSDTLVRDGKGPAFKNTGMIWSAFRPSDDACEYSFHIPNNYFAASVLGAMRRIFADYYEDARKATKAFTLKNSILRGLEKYGKIQDRYCGEILPYETDGMGSFSVFDDANVPSLLGLPIIGAISKNSEIYQNTRRFVLSPRNPYYFRGKLVSGVGSAHTPQGYVWPIGLMVEALTDDSKERREEILDILINTTAGTGFMHESFDANDDTKYTREWFAWANSLFAYLVRDMLIDNK